MTKLEEKLIQLGYRQKNKTYIIYAKQINGILFELIVNGDIFGKIIVLNSIHTQQDIDNLQQAFNQLQKDLEVLKDEKNK